MKNQRGLAPIAIILMVVGVLVLAGGVWYLYQNLNIPAGEQSPYGAGKNQNIQTPTTQDETANWQTYRNEKYGLEFKYPADFTVSPSYTASRQIISISKKGLSGEFDVDVVWEHEESAEKWAESLVNPNKTTENYILDNIAGVKVMSDNIGFPGRNITVAVIKNNYLYLISCATIGKDENTLIGLYNKILSTFKFTK